MNNETRVDSPVRACLTFDAFRVANVTRCLRWHPKGIDSWSPSDWLTALVGEVGELASLLKMMKREADGLPGNKFSPTSKMIADEIADVQTYLDLLAASLGVDLGRATVEKFNEVSERVGFPDRIDLRADTTPSELACRCGIALASDCPGCDWGDEPPRAACRSDGRCQYAIDVGAEGMGTCPAGKCAMPAVITIDESTKIKPLIDQLRSLSVFDWASKFVRDFPTLPSEPAEVVYGALGIKSGVEQSAIGSPLTDEKIDAMLTRLFDAWQHAYRPGDEDAGTPTHVVSHLRFVVREEMGSAQALPPIDFRAAVSYLLNAIDHGTMAHVLREAQCVRAVERAVREEMGSVDPQPAVLTKAGHGEVVATLTRGAGGAFRVRPNADNLPAIYALPPGEHSLYAGSPPTADGWLRAIDEAMVVHHLGTAEASDDYETAKRKVNLLLTTAQDIGAYFALEGDLTWSWSGHDLDAMVEAFARIVEAHIARTRPFQDPIGIDALLALRTLRGFVPQMKRLAQGPKR